MQDQLEVQHFVEWQKRVQDQLEDQHFVEWQKRCKISWKTNTS